ncbi:MAG: hypothetical protein RMY29_028315 [Nostoc sp. CreGUA01]|nr:hypothetical protein [Nostoc sp. CreGUA01]
MSKLSSVIEVWEEDAGSGRRKDAKSGRRGDAESGRRGDVESGRRREIIKYPLCILFPPRPRVPASPCPRVPASPCPRIPASFNLPFSDSHQ